MVSKELRDLPLKFVTFWKKEDFRVTEFRRQVCIELGVTEDYLEQHLSLEQVKKKFPNLRPTEAEEVYKFGSLKWAKTKFNSLEGLVVDNQLVSISGSRFYGPRLLRVGMHHYTLCAFRSRFRGLFFRQKGFFERHISSALSSIGVKYVFFSVYPHNRRLAAVAKNLMGRCVSMEGLEMTTLKQIKYLPDPIRLHGVDQYLFVYDLFPSENWQEEFKAELEQALEKGAD